MLLRPLVILYESNGSCLSIIGYLDPGQVIASNPNTKAISIPHAPVYIANAIIQNNVPTMKAPGPYPGSLIVLVLRQQL